jgi:hypothetical protein
VVRGDGEKEGEAKERVSPNDDEPFHRPHIVPSSSASGMCLECENPNVEHIANVFVPLSSD